MAEAFIIDAVRTPVGRRGGGLSQEHPADLGAHALKALMARTGVDPAAVDDVVWGCCDTLGPQAGDIGRTCWLAAGLPEHVPGVTIDRQCGSSQQSVHFAAQAVMSGTADLVAARLVDNETQLSLRGSYTPPLGWVGEALDRALLHRVAESTVKEFVDRIASYTAAEVVVPVPRDAT